MRAAGRLANTSAGPTTTKHALLFTSSSFSTNSGNDGCGRGRGRGGISSSFPGKLGPAAYDDDAEADSFTPPGLGRGRGRPLSPPLVTNVFSTWIPSASASVGRGRSQPPTTPPPPQQQQQQSPPDSSPKAPVFFRRGDADSESAGNIDSFQTQQESVFPRSILSGVHGMGRGQMVKPPETETRAAPEENRHLRRGPPVRGRRQPGSPTTPRLGPEEAVESAGRILRGGRGGRPEAGGRGRGGRAHGRGRGMQALRGRGGRGVTMPGREMEEGDGAELLDSLVDWNKLRERLGEEKMNLLNEAFEEMCSRVFPSVADEAYLDALDTNYSIEFEPEYAMEEFGTNPDIDDTPPIPLRDALEKMKPFLMAYEGIQSQEEWEEIIQETMEKVPYFKQLIDMYAGPDRTTAMQEQEKLEKVAKALPETVPSSVKIFTDRALLTLQSNPGWGFEKKYQFMDKLVREVTQPKKW